MTEVSRGVAQWEEDDRRERKRMEIIAADLVRGGMPVHIHDDTADRRRERYRLTRLVNELMGKNPAKRLAFIVENAKFVKDLDI